MTYGPNALALIRHFEGCRLAAYQDAVGVWTIGYGCTEHVCSGMTCSAAEAETLLLAAADRRAPELAALLRVPVAQHQFDALFSFAYNLGLGTLGRSSLLRLVNARDFGSAGAEFPKWTHAGGRVLPGLVKRRIAEQTLFRTGVLVLPD